MLTHRDRTAVFLDQPGHVVAAGPNGSPENGPATEMHDENGILVDRQRLFVPVTAMTLNGVACVTGHLDRR